MSSEVHHPKFGDGVVTSQSSLRYTVNFHDHGEQNVHHDSLTPVDGETEMPTFMDRVIDILVIYSIPFWFVLSYWVQYKYAPENKVILDLERKVIQLQTYPFWCAVCRNTDAVAPSHLCHFHEFQGVQACDDQNRIHWFTFGKDGSNQNWKHTWDRLHPSSCCYNCLCQQQMRGAAMGSCAKGDAVYTRGYTRRFHHEMAELGYPSSMPDEVLFTTYKPRFSKSKNQWYWTELVREE